MSTECSLAEVSSVTRGSKTSAEEQHSAEHHRRVYVEYFIDWPPCPRRRRRLLSAAAAMDRPCTAGQIRRRAGSTSTAENAAAATQRLLPATPTAEDRSSWRAVEDHLEEQHPAAEFQRRMSPFRRGHAGDRVRRPASATPVMAADQPPSSALRPRSVAVDAGHVVTDSNPPRPVCSLQQMIRQRRTSGGGSCCSSVANSNWSVADHRNQV